jgi:hypothetical protein
MPVVPVVPVRPPDAQRGLAHRHGEVGPRPVVGTDQRGRADVPPRGGIGGHQPPGLGQHQRAAAAADRAHFALRHAPQGMQRKHVEFLAQRPDQLVPPAERVHRLGDQGGRDVVPGGQPQALVGVAEQPAQRRQRVIGQRGRFEQARDEPAGKP